MSERHACFWVFHHTLALRDIAKSSRLITDPKTDRGLIARLRFLWLLLQLQLQQELFSVPPQGLETDPESSDKDGCLPTSGAESCALDARSGLDDARLAWLIGVWPTLPEAVRSSVCELIDSVLVGDEVIASIDGPSCGQP